MNRNPKFLFQLRPCLCALLFVAGSAFAVDEKDVVPIDRDDLIAEKVGKPIVVTGTVKTAAFNSSKGHAWLVFAEGDAQVFIAKQYVEEHGNKWEIDKLTKKKIYVAGKVTIYEDRPQIVIMSPDQIADSPDGFDMKEIAALYAKKKPAVKKGPAAPGAIAPAKEYGSRELVNDYAEVQTVAFYLKGTDVTWSKDNPFGKNPFKIPYDRRVATLATVTAEAEDKPGIGAMQIAFPKPESDSAKAIQELVDKLAAELGSWPQDKLVTIDVDFDSKGFRDDPSHLVIAVLLQSMIKGDEIPKTLVVSGDVEGDTLVSPGVNGGKGGQVSNGDIVRAIAEDIEEPIRFVRAPMGYAELNDFALDGEWETLSKVTVLTADNFADGLKLAFATPEDDLGKALMSFDQVQAVIKKSGARMVKNKEVQQRVLTAGKAYPQNQSAVFYAFYGKGRVPRAYSPQRTRQIIREHQEKVQRILTAMPSDAKDQFRDLGKELKSLGPKLEKDLLPIANALDDFQDEVSTAVLKPKDEDDERGFKRQKEGVEEAAEKLDALLDELTTKIETGAEE